jgi:hypothetical protein
VTVLGLVLAVFMGLALGLLGGSILAVADPRLRFRLRVLRKPLLRAW